METKGSEINSSLAIEYTLSGEEAFFGVLFAAATADGKICENQLQNIWSIIHSMRLYKGIPTERWDKVVDHLTYIFNNDGHETLTRITARYLPASLRETAFTIAVDILFSDGVVNYDEKIYMERLKEFLGVKPEYAAQVVEVMAMKYFKV